MKKTFRERCTWAGAKRFARHIVAKPFMNMVVYKYIPSLFLLARFGVRKNTNTGEYWSSVHSKEAVAENAERFAYRVLSLLDGVDFSGKDVLDVGCGRGAFLSNIPHAKSRTGVDISSSAIAELERKGIQGFVRELPHLNLQKTFDIITCFETLEHTAHWKDSLRSMIIHLRENGLLVVSVPFENGILIHEHVTYFDLDRMYGFLRKHITVLQIQLLGPWQVYICQKKQYARSEVYDWYGAFFEISSV